MSNLDFDPRYIPDPTEIIGRAQRSALGSVVGSQEGTSDDAARSLDISKVTGVPASVVAGDLEHHEQKLKTNLSADLIRNNPYLQDYINSHPLAAQLSKDDLGNLDKASQSMDKLQKGYLENTGDIVKHALDFFRKGPSDYKELGATTRAKLIADGVDPVQIDGIVKNVEANAYRGEALQNVLFLGYTLALSPALGAFRTYASHPIEESTGFPADATEGLTMVALAALGLKALANPRVAAGATGHIFPRGGGPAEGPKGVGSVRKTMEDSAAYFGEKPEDISTWSDQQLRDFLIEKTSAVTKEAQDVADVVKPYTDAGKEPPIGVHKVIDEANIEVSTAEVDALMDSIKAAQKSSTKELNPDMYAGFVRGQVGDQTIGIHAAVLDTLYGDKPFAPDDGIIGFTENLENKLDIARATGGYVDISMADYIAKVDPQVAKQLEDFTRVRPEGVSKGEAKDIKASVEAYHGSPHDFEAFSMEKIGTGEGAQSYGHGLYFAENKEVAQHYEASNSRGTVLDTIGGKAWNANDPYHVAARYVYREGAGDPGVGGGLLRDEVIKAKKRADKNPMEMPEYQKLSKALDIIHEGDFPEFDIKGNQYRVRINADKEQFLDHDTALRDQPVGKKLLETMDPAFKERLEEILEEHDQAPLEELTGGEFRQLLQRYASEDSLPGDTTMGGAHEKEASEFLKRSGVPGIKYLDQGSRGGIHLSQLLEESKDSALSEAARATAKTEYEKALAQQTHNFVLFDDSLVEITHKNDQPLPPKYAHEAVRDASRLNSRERKLTLQRFAEDEQSFHSDTGLTTQGFQILDVEGKPVADLFVAEENNGKRLYVDDIRSLGGNAHVIGPRALRDLLQQLKAEFPKAEELSGYRVSGARDKAGSWETNGKVTIKLAEPTAADHLFQILLDDRIERLGEQHELGEGFTATTVPEHRWQNFERSIVKQIDAEIEKLGISDIDVEAVHKIESAKGELVRGLYQSYEDARPSILVALTADDPVGVLRHEFMHDLRTRGFLSEEEWAALEHGADESAWIEKHDIRTRYPDLDEAGWKEEAIADEYANWRREGKPADTIYAKIFQKIDQLIEAIRAAMRQLFGTENWKDIFDKIEKGEVASRDPLNEFGDVTKEAKGPSQPELPFTRRMEDRDVFAEAQAAGFTKDGYLRWMKAFAERHREDLRLESERALKEAKKRQTDKWKEDSAKLREQVVEQINERPDIAADNLLREQRLLGHKTDPVKIGTEYLSKEQIAALPKYYVAKAGDNPDTIAGLVGYGSGQDLINGLAGLEAARKASGLRGIEYTRALISAETERQMEAKYGKLSENILEDAKEQVMSESQLDMLSEEVLADAMKAGVEYSITKQQMKDWVGERFAEMSAKDVSSDKFLADAGRAGRTVEDELIRHNNTGKMEHLVLAFRQRVNQYRSIMFAKLAKDFEKAQTQVDAVAEHFRPREVKNTDPQFTGYLQGLFNQAGYPTKSTPQEIAETIKFYGHDSLDSFVTDRRSYGDEIAVEEGWSAKPKDQMTTAEFMQFKQAVDSLYHAGKASKKITVANDKMEYEDWRKEAIASLERRPPRPMKMREDDSHGNWLYNIDAPLTRIEELMKDFDFREELGPFFQAVIVPYAKSKADAFDMLTKLSKDIKELPHLSDKQWRRGLDTEISQDFIIDPDNGLPFEMTRWNMLKMMMNMGTDSNFSALAKGIITAKLGRIAKKDEIELGRQWIEQFIHANATEKDWQFVQRLFDMFKEWKPKADKIYRNLSGVPPKWIPDRAIDTPHGQFAGGYFPLIPDKSRLVGPGIRMAGEQVGNGPLGADFFRATVHNPFYKERTGATYWVDITNGMEQLAGRMQQVIHDIAYRDFVVDAGKILYDPKIQHAIKKYYGKEYENQLQPWLKRIANEFTGNERELGEINRTLRQVRLNLISAALPLNYTVMLSPSLGTANLKTLFAFNSDRAANKKLVMENSRELQHMLYNLDRDVSAAINHVIGESKFTEYQVKAVQAFMTPLTWFEQQTRMNTFYGEFMHQRSLGKTDFEAATLGDSLIRERHGASAVGDLPALMANKNEIVRAATVFMGYFTTTRNWLRQLPHEVREGNVSNSMKILWGTLGIAALYNVALFTRRKENESDASYYARAVLSTPLGMVPYVREWWSYSTEGYAPTSPVFGLFKAVADLGKDGYKAYEGKRVKDPVKHSFNVAGLLGGLPAAIPVGRAADFLNDVRRGEQQPKGIVEWMRGIFTGEARLKK